METKGDQHPLSQRGAFYTSSDLNPVLTAAPWGRDCCDVSAEEGEAQKS